MALAPVWLSKWHLRCVWREADGCLRLLRRRRELRPEGGIGGGGGGWGGGEREMALNDVK